MAYRNIHYDRDAILEAIRDGQTYGEISAAHNVSRQVISRLAITHGLRRQDNRGPERACDGCGIRIWGDKALCKPCQDFYIEPPAPEELPGAWVIDLRRRVVVHREAS